MIRYLILCLISINGLSQSAYELDADFLKSIDGKYFAFSYYDDAREKPTGLMFQLKYEQKDSSFIIKNLSALSKWDGTSYKGKLLTLKQVDTAFLLFEGQLQAKYKNGDSQDVECELKIKLFSGTDKIESWLYLPSNKTIWGYAEMGTQATAQKIYDKNISKQPIVVARNQVVTELSDDASLIVYLQNKTFKSASGTTVKIGSNSEYNTYGIIINGKMMYFNLTYTILTRYTAIVKGESFTDNSLLKIVVDTKSNSLVNGGSVYSLQ